MELWSPRLIEYYDPLMAGSIDGTDSVPHDHGIVRAMECNYKPNKSVTGEADKTIFVSRLDWDTTESTLRSVFSRFGPIRNVRVVSDLVTGFSKGYAFIEYEEEQFAVNAYRYGDKTAIDGRGVFVDFECERNLSGWVPRRLGGGFGGKKESGQLRFGGRDRPFRKPLIPNLRVYNEQHDSNPYKQHRTDIERNESNAIEQAEKYAERPRESASYRNSRSRSPPNRSDRFDDRSSQHHDNDSRSHRHRDDKDRYRSDKNRSDYDRRERDSSSKHSSKQRNDRNSSRQHSHSSKRSRYRDDKSRSRSPSGHRSRRSPH